MTNRGRLRSEATDVTLLIECRRSQPFPCIEDRLRQAVDSGGKMDPASSSLSSTTRDRQTVSSGLSPKMRQNRQFAARASRSRGFPPAKVQPLVADLIQQAALKLKTLGDL